MRWPVVRASEAPLPTLPIFRSPSDRLVSLFADFTAVDPHNADPVGTDPPGATDRPDFAAARLHSAG